MEKEKKSDYESALERVSSLPKFYLGQEVETKDGRGIIVSLNMFHNGLYLSPESSSAVVWFSTEKAAATGSRWVNAVYLLSELKPIHVCEPNKHFYYKFIYKDKLGVMQYEIVEVSEKNSELAIAKFEKENPKIVWRSFLELK
jgi:hypothetical protein